MQNNQYKEGVNPFEIMLNKKVQAITTDGRVFADQAMNCVLQNSEERVYSIEKGVEFINAGLQMIRGDTVAVIGEIKPDTEETLNFDNIKAHPLPPIMGGQQ